MDFEDGDGPLVVGAELAYAVERLCLLLAASSQRDAVAEARATATLARALQAAAAQTASPGFALPPSCCCRAAVSPLPNDGRPPPRDAHPAAKRAAEMARAALAPLATSVAAAAAACRLMNRNKLEALVLAHPAAGEAFGRHELLLAASAHTQLLASLALGVAVAADATGADAVGASVDPAAAAVAVAAVVSAPLDALWAVGAFVALSVAAQGCVADAWRNKNVDFTSSLAAAEAAAPSIGDACAAAAAEAAAPVAIGALREPWVAAALAAMQDVGSSGPRRALVGHLVLPARAHATAAAGGGDEVSACRALKLDVAMERDRATSSASAVSAADHGHHHPGSSGDGAHAADGGREAGLRGGSGGAAWATPGFRLLLTKDRKTLAYVLVEVVVKRPPAVSSAGSSSAGSSRSNNSSGSAGADSSSSLGNSNSNSNNSNSNSSSSSLGNSNSNSNSSSSSSNSSSSSLGNSNSSNSSTGPAVEWCLRGMLVDPSLRGRGLSQLLLGLWLLLARKCGAGVGPTRRIKKPLVALALQRWGFAPTHPETAIHVELASPPLLRNPHAPPPRDDGAKPVAGRTTAARPGTGGRRKRPWGNALGSSEEADGARPGTALARKTPAVKASTGGSVVAPITASASAAVADGEIDADGEGSTSLSKNERKRRAKAAALAAKKAAKRARTADDGMFAATGAGDDAEGEEGLISHSTSNGTISTSRSAARSSSPPPRAAVVLWSPDEARVLSVLSKSELAAQGLGLSRAWPPPVGWQRKAVALNACFAPPAPGQLRDRVAALFVGAVPAAAPAAAGAGAAAEAAAEARDCGEEALALGERSGEGLCLRRFEKPELTLYATKLLQAVSPGQWGIMDT
jgi:hypothetical protein